MKRSLNPSKNITTMMFKIGSVSTDFTFSVDFQVSWLTASYFLFRKWQDIYFDSRCCDVLFFKPSQIYCTANLITALAVSTSARGGILALPHGREAQYFPAHRVFFCFFFFSQEKKKQFFQFILKLCLLVLLKKKLLFYFEVMLVLFKKDQVEI